MDFWRYEPQKHQVAILTKNHCATSKAQKETNERRNMNNMYSLRGGLHQEVPKKKNRKSYQTLKKHSHSSNTPFTSPNDALSRHQKKILDLMRFSQVQFSSFKWGWGPKILSSIIITDILTMSSPVFARRMEPLILFRARECGIEFSPKMPRFNTFYFQVCLKSYLNVSTSRILWYDFVLWFDYLQRVSHD